MKLSLTGSNIINVKAHNMRVVLLHLLYEEQLSRSEIAKRTNLSNTTISKLIAELIEEGIVQSGDDDVNQDVDRPVGRPRTAICLIPNARFVIGIHVGVGVFRVAINNLRNEIVWKRMEAYNVLDPPTKVLDQINQSVEALIAESRINRKIILGVGVGLSGIVDFHSGVNVFAPNLNWRQVPARDIFESRLKLPIVVDNNVRCMALGETYFGKGRGLDSLVFVYGRIGVGAGFICQGQIFRGSTMGAGEFGHNIILLDDTPSQSKGKHRELESLVSEKIILQRGEEILRLHPEGILAKVVRTHPDFSHMDCLIEAATQGDKSVKTMFSDLAFHLGIGLVNMVNLYNPELILLGGLFAQAKDIFLDPVRKTVQQFAFADLGKQVRIDVTKFGWKAGVIGAAALALTHFFYLNE